MTTTQTSQTIVHIPTPLRSYTSGNATVTVKADTVGEALDQLTTQHPDLKQHLYSEDGTLRSFVNIFRGDENIRDLDQEDTALREQDDLSIVPAVAGGRVAACC